MSRHSSHYRSVLVVNLALNDSLSEGAVIFRGWNLGLPFRRRTETCARHSQRRKDFLLRKEIERQTSLLRQHLTEQDESNVAVFGTCAGRRDKPSCERGTNQLVSRLRELE